MDVQDLLDMADSQVGYHEKEYGTPVPALYPFQNSYDGQDNWTKYVQDLGQAQGQAWCGFFAYWCFYQVLGNSIPDTEDFLHNISNYSACGGAVSSWANAFNDVNRWHENDGYEPKPGDLVVYSDTGVPWSHVEIVYDASGWPSTIQCVGGNTKQPWESGSESESQWCAKRIRSATATTGFHVRGYCEVDYDGISGLPIYLIAQAYFRKKLKAPEEEFFEV